MKRKSTLILVVTMILALTITACGNPSAPAQADGDKKPKQLVAQIGPNPETLDPALNSAVDGGNMLLFAFDCLLNVDKDNKIIPGAAEKWETSEDGLTWTFYLREGLKWSDGSPLTAKDFVYSWKRVADPATAAPYGETVLGMVKGFDEAAAGNPDALAVSAPDDTTFVVELANPCAYFDKLAAFATLSPVQQATIEANGDAWATKPEAYIGNGPFQISEWVPSSYILFTKNPNYRDPDSIKLDSIKLLLIEDSNASYAAYKTGEAMMIKDVPTAEIPSLQGKDDFYIEPLLGTYYLDLNNTLPQFSDPRVRMALSLAIDRKYVADTLMQGTYTPASNFIGTGVADWDGSSFMDNANGGKPYINIDDHEGNLAKAKELLAEAGYPEGKGFPAITYSTNDSAYHKVVAQYLQQAWKELGLTVNVEIVEWASFTPQRRAGDYQTSRDGWLFDYNDASNMLDLMYSTNGNNNAKYKSAEYDALMARAAAEVDPEKRSGYLHQAEDHMMADAAVVPVAYYNEFYLQSPKITGSWHSPYGYWYFQYADIVE
ncbi:peptide/nickel transport system substrate-binding protein/oligopeptide transport system substrate-binding protein [Desulfitobacterium sp. LBE]|uniref:peptide ABC transporter substrate-binding protein n=1 Tax=Desulfitobacterium sp. LBE TaxID=884086 RepID=UPI001199164F|nr:peptide ABC transporter substrate-binding protein [Desulfitobacterium sp. LBE]TWH56141.1 peptide/nickel transport system substrate-binding protein/oligopeptide transport system substrate-binding protein [Desulfitobacterium sp. LBE]